MMELAREAGACVESDVEPVVDPLAGLSPCDRANYELRAARYMAKLAANAAASGQNVSNTSLDLYVDTAAGTRVGTPRNDTPSSPSVRLQQAVASLRNGMGGLLHPVLRLLQAAGRGSTIAIAAEKCVRVRWEYWQGLAPFRVRKTRNKLWEILRFGGRFLELVESKTTRAVWRAERFCA
jgi:hypothetical protein